jgi:hypothetical protein
MPVRLLTSPAGPLSPGGSLPTALWKKAIVHFSRLELSALFVSDESNNNNHESNMYDFLALLNANGAGNSLGAARYYNATGLIYLIRERLITEAPDFYDGGKPLLTSGWHRTDMLVVA